MLDDTALEIVRVWNEVRTCLLPGIPRDEDVTERGKKHTVTVTPYHLDPSKIKDVVELLEPEVETDELLECLRLMFGSHAREEVLYKLPPDLAAKFTDDPHWMEHERERLGFLD